ncbi:MAG: hypothetical protein FWC91_08030 [Defluviitaleaceae bacterium]|nr:hypothetical protein [Defluviitaleaceae bacterium]
MESVGKYLLHTHNESAMAVQQFTWHSLQDQAVLEWQWPPDKKVKLMLIFPLEDTECSGVPDIAQLLEWNECTVVSRNLSSGFRGSIQGRCQRFLICPAYFNESNKVVVYKPAYTTDLIYKKSRVSARAFYKPLPLSRYTKVTLDIELPEGIQSPCKALQYGIYENNRLIGVYPLDKNVIAGKYTIYIRKKQQVKFMVEEAYAHQFEIEI